MATQDTDPPSPGPRYNNSSQRPQVYEEPQPVLQLAAAEGRLGIINKILEVGGVDVNLKNSCGDTPLTAAAQFGYAPTVERLLKEKGIEIDKKKLGGFTPLIAASIYGSIDTVNLLLENGANPKLKDSTGKTALDWARDKIAVEPHQDRKEVFAEVARLLEDAIKRHEESKPLNGFRGRIKSVLHS